MIRQVPGTGDSLELSAVRGSQVRVLDWPGWSGEAWCAFLTVSRGNKEPDITEDGADNQRLKNRSFLESTLVRSDNDRTVRNELFDSRGALVSIIIVESNWTRGEDQHGLGWHCMALHGIGIGIAQFQSAGAR